MQEIALPYEQTNQAAIGRFIDTIGAIKQQRAQRQLQSGLLQVMAQGGGPDQIAGFMAGQNVGGVQRQQPKQYGSGIGGFMSRIGAAVNPMNTDGVDTPLGNGIADVLIQRAMNQNPLEDDYKRSLIAENNAQAEYRKRLPGIQAQKDAQEQTKLAAEREENTVKQLQSIAENPNASEAARAQANRLLIPLMNKRGFNLQGDRMDIVELPPMNPLDPINGRREGVAAMLPGEQMFSPKATEGTSRYSKPDVLGENNELGLPKGTLVQMGTNGKVDIIYQPKPGESKTGMSSKDTLETATVLRKEFDQSKTFTDFQTVNRAEKGIMQAYKTSLDPKTQSKVASDQALAVMFQKMLDPTSVVRESEYARTPEGVGVVSRLESYIPKFQKGGLAISDTDRKAMVDIANKLLNESKVTMNDHIDRYTGISQQYGVDPNLVLGNIKRFNIPGAVAPANTPQQSPAITSVQTDDDYLKLPSGAQFTAPDGTLRVKP